MSSKPSEVAVRSKTRAVAVRSGVDPDAEPSVDWGWHQNFTKGIPIAAVLAGIVLLLFTIGHPVSWTESLYMGLPAVACILGAIWYSIRRRRSWRH